MQVVDVLILDDDAEFYRAALAKEPIGTRLHVAISEAEALKLCAEAEILVAMAHRVTPRLIAAMPRLKFIQALTTGTDHLATLNLPADIAIASMRGMHGPQMAEMAFLYMLALSRDAARMQAQQRAKAWVRWPQPLLIQKTLVIVGVGAISQALATRAKVFGMRVVGVSDARSEVADFDEIMPRSALAVAAAQADFLVVLAPLTQATLSMIDAGVFAAMKQGVIFINLARGPVVNEAALVESLRSGHLGAAGLDVFEIEPLPANSPLWDLPEVMITPHIGGMSDIYAQQALPILAENLRAWQTAGVKGLRNLVEVKGDAS